MTSLNPVYTIGDQIVEAIRLHQQTPESRPIGSAAAWRIAEKALADVGIADPDRRLRAYPHQMSGGMRQRVMIAMALACEPELLIADEPTTALDVTIQAQILELLRKLQQDRGMAILMITHDLGVVAENADVVYVMYASRIVEAADVDDLFDRPTHPYTRALLNSMPTMGGARRTRLETIPGNVPNVANFPSGCKFHTRCPRTRELAAGRSAEETVEVSNGEDVARVLKRCVIEEPDAREVAPSHWAACHQVDGWDAAPRTRPTLAHKRSVTAEIEPGSAVTA
jgi:oligopeptide/dipeptide ABC transporter ATP-binding protein